MFVCPPVSELRFYGCCHPCFRTTYQDHWFDNFGNAIVGHLFAQILVPLDNQENSLYIHTSGFALSLYGIHVQEEWVNGRLALSIIETPHFIPLKKRMYVLALWDRVSNL